MKASKKFIVLIMLGKSGSGKGTQTELLAKKFHLAIISSGTLLRKKAKEKDSTGKKINRILRTGGLAPTPIIFHLWLHELERIRSVPRIRGVIFEGSPRKVYEAFLLQEALEFYEIETGVYALSLDISNREAMKRLLLRARKDDTPEAIKNRLFWFQKEVKPVIAFYQKQGLLVRINGEQPIQAIHEEILRKLRTILR